MLLNAILWCAIVIVTSDSVSYTKVSYTNERELCMTDCIKGECFAFDRKNHHCHPGSTFGLQYYTTREKTKVNLCKSRCGKVSHEKKNWCFISDDEWDYCNPIVARNDLIQHISFTTYKEPCKDECGHRDDTDYLWCYNYFDKWHYCDDEKFTYMKTQTKEELDCMGACKPPLEGKYGNWCTDYDGTIATCAAPARIFPLLNSIYDRVSELNDSIACPIISGQDNENRGYPRSDSSVSGLVLEYAQLLEFNNVGLFTKIVNESGNAITRYTTMPNAYRADPTLPLVIRAKVTPETLSQKDPHRNTSFSLRVKENLQRMGADIDKNLYKYNDDGHIISYTIGGPDEVYNYVHQTRVPLADVHWPPLWYDTEFSIRDFVMKSNGWVDITILVVYSRLPKSWIPEGYAVNLAIYNHDYTLNRLCNNYFYSNHPKNKK